MKRKALLTAGAALSMATLLGVAFSNNAIASDDSIGQINGVPTVDLIFVSPFEESVPHIVLTATPNPVIVAGQSNLHWEVVDSISCSMSDGPGTAWSAISNPPPMGDFLVENVFSTKRFTMTCDNDIGQTTRTVVLGAVSDVSGFPGFGVFPLGCDTNPIPGVEWQASPSSYAGLFMPWPGEFGDWQNVAVDTDKWISLYFDTGPDITSGKMETAPNNWLGGDRPKIFSFSECPGDFVSMPAACLFSPASTSGLLWWANEDSGGAVCFLQPNTRYYMNIIYAAPDNLQQTLCTDVMNEPLSSCGFQGIPRGPWL